MSSNEFKQPQKITYSSPVDLMRIHYGKRVIARWDLNNWRPKFSLMTNNFSLLFALSISFSIADLQIHRSTCTTNMRNKKHLMEKFILKHMFNNSLATTVSCTWVFFLYMVHITVTATMLPRLFHSFFVLSFKYCLIHTLIIRSWTLNSRP